MRFVLVPLASMLLLATVGCGTSRTAEGRDSGCASCHGFPPAGTHPQPTAGSPWAAATCSGCHSTSVGPNGELIPASAGGTHADGNTNVTPPPGHTTAFLDTTDPVNRKLHGALANQRIDVCAACHGADFGATTFGQSCNGCHTSIGFADWQTNCTFCHGTKTPSWLPANIALAAPPQDVSGSSDTTLPTVGAHQTHVAGALIACTACHPSPQPVNVLSAGHIDAAQATVQFSGLAITGGLSPVWTVGPPATCATVYCHGASLVDGGGTNTTPTWTDVGSGQADCGACHALPPPAATHPQPWPTLAFTLPDCNLCHDATVDATGALLSGHLDGTTATAPDCTSCHTPPARFHTRSSAQATSPLACAVCHVGFAPATHVTAYPSAAVTCATCHGDAAAIPAPTATSPRTAAPPTDKFGNTVSVVVGAHAAHLDKTDFRTSPIACAQCHQGVASYTNRHANGTTDLVFSVGTQTGGTFTPGASGASGTCASTWCHGSFPGGANATPAWDGPAIALDVAGCTSCHPYSPTTGKHVAHVNVLNFNCSTCHTTGYTSTISAGVVTNVTIESAGKIIHANGEKTVTPIAATVWTASTSNCSGGCHTATAGGRPWYLPWP